jgi:hypothetical protein
MIVCTNGYHQRSFIFLDVNRSAETIITATTDQYSAFADTVFETIAWRESSGKRLLPKSVDDMVKLVLGMQTTYFAQENIPLNSTDSKNPKKFKSVLNVFRESIRDVVSLGTVRQKLRPV